jgi:5-methylcytosine-specific restriction protein A
VPHKPPHPCAHPGRAELTRDRYCAAHAKSEAAAYNRFQRDPDSNRRYGRRWKQIRALYLAAHPLCERCNAGGRFVAATLVHHKRSVRDGGTHEVGNLMSLCASCHERIHGAQGDRR